MVLVRAGFQADMGFGNLGDALVTIALFGIALLGAIPLAWLGLTVLRRIPSWLLVVGASAIGAGFLLVRHRDEALLDGLLIAAGVALAAWLGSAAGGLIQALRQKSEGMEAARARGPAVVNAVAAATTCLLIGGWLVASPGPGPLGTGAEAWGSGAEAWGTAAFLSAPDPVEPGPYPVESFTYGSGTDQRRPAYGDQVVLTTLSQDLRPLLPGFQGIEAQRHRAHWGFGLEAVPLNATVWMPMDEGPFPVIVLIPGIDPESERSELGYAYLGELLASRGYVVVGTDMNFLGRPHIARTAGEMPVRAWLALKHLELLGEWQAAHPGSRADRMDLTRIVLGGHSRGGEAAVLAAKLNSLERYPPNAAIQVPFGFPIAGVFALAPTDQTFPMAGQGARLSDVSYLVLHGSGDADVSSFMGMAQYNRVQIPEGSHALKASVYIQGANHRNFNALSGGRDVSGITGMLLDRSRLLDGEDQRHATAAFVSAFVEAVLRRDDRYRAFLEDPRGGAAWLPPTGYVTRYDDGRTVAIATFEEDLDPGTGTLPGTSIDGRSLTVWREEPLTLPGLGDRPADTRVLHLAWNRNAGIGADPAWELHLQDLLPGEALDPEAKLRFSMGHPDGAGKHFPVAVELETIDGQLARVDPALFGPGLPGERPRLWRLPVLNRLMGTEPDRVLQDYLIPLRAFQEVEPAFDPSRLRTIRFIFGGAPAGQVLLNDIGIRTSDASVAAEVAEEY